MSCSTAGGGRTRVELAKGIFEYLEIFHDLPPLEDDFGRCRWANAVACSALDVSPRSIEERPSDGRSGHPLHLTLVQSGDISTPK